MCRPGSAPNTHNCAGLELRPSVTAPNYGARSLVRAAAMSEEAPSLQQQVAESVFEALPDLQEDELVELLDFVFQQHSGGAFNPDNTPKKEAIVRFVKERPFAVSERGVARRAHPDTARSRYVALCTHAALRRGSLCKLSRHCLQKSEAKGNSAEHQLWLLSSGALNTAAAIAHFDGDSARCFEALDRETGGGLERGKYLHRHYAMKAMRKYVDQEQAVAAQAVERPRWLTPQNLPAAWTIAAVLAVLSSWLVSLWLFPVSDWT